MNTLLMSLWDGIFIAYGHFWGVENVLFWRCDVYIYHDDVQAIYALIITEVAERNRSYDVYG